MEYVGRGGQLLFFPPTEVTSGIGASQTEFQGVRWSGWTENATPATAGSAALLKLVQLIQQIQLMRKRQPSPARWSRIGAAIKTCWPSRAAEEGCQSDNWRFEVTRRWKARFHSWQR